MAMAAVRRPADLCSDSVPSDGDRGGAHLLPQAFGRNLKLGVIEDAGSRDQLAPLLRFPTSKSGEDMTSLDEYVGRCGCRHGHLDAHRMGVLDRTDAVLFACITSAYCHSRKSVDVQAPVLALSPACDAELWHRCTAEAPSLPAPG